jgi:hypothetical protein
MYVLGMLGKYAPSRLSRGLKASDSIVNQPPSESINESADESTPDEVIKTPLKKKQKTVAATPVSTSTPRTTRSLARILEVSEGYDSPTEEDNDVYDKDIALRLNEKAPLVSLLYYHASFLKINHLLLSTFRVGRLTISISFHRQRKLGSQLQLFVKNLERRRKGKLQISPWICVKYRHYDLCTMVI